MSQTTLTQAKKRTRSTPATTRSRLLDAALLVMRAQGIGAATTVNITQAAGMAQSSFYMHFTGVDDCQAAAAEQVAKRIRTFIAEDRQRIHNESPEGEAAHAAHYQSVLNLFLEERPLAELLLKGRYDNSPVGQVMRQLTADIRDDLMEYLWQVATSLGIGEKHRDRAALLAEFIQAKVLAAGEALIAGRITDRELLAMELAATISAESIDLVQRCLADRS